MVPSPLSHQLPHYGPLARLRMPKPAAILHIPPLHQFDPARALGIGYHGDAVLHLLVRGAISRSQKILNLSVRWAAPILD